MGYELVEAMVCLEKKGRCCLGCCWWTLQPAKMGSKHKKYQSVFGINHLAMRHSGAPLATGLFSHLLLFPTATILITYSPT